jgi:predicted metal-binding membrane protein
MDGAISRGAVAILLVGAAACWWIVVGQAAAMPGGPGPMGLRFGSFLILWTAMMAAMMVPVVAPVAGLYAASLTSGSRAARTAGLVLGYLTVWSALGAVAYPATLSGGWLARSHSEWAPWAASAIFAGTAAYQLSPLRARCLAHCRAPFALLFRMAASSPRPFRDVRAGMLHGTVCAACCLPLMACLLALGAMSIGWMLALTIVVAAERRTRIGPWVTRAAAAALLVLAVAVPLHPQLATGLHMPAAPMPM